MRRLALFAIALAFTAGIGRAQHAPAGPPVLPTNDSASQNPNEPPMTPRQIAVMRAQILMARKDYQQAAVAYQLLLQDDPRNPDFLNQVGMAYQQLGDGERAEHFYRRAIRADKNYSRAINNLGTLEYAKHRYGKAIKYYKKAISAGGDLAPIYSNLGYAYCGIKLFPEAMQAFAKALAIDPEVFEHHGGGGSVFQQRSAVDPGVLYFMLAKSYAKTGDAERTARYLKLSRDDGYKDFLSARKDPDFARVIKDPQVQEVLRVQPTYAAEPQKPVSN
jgi:tetratricopeptide (TPR) repeat protein